MKRKSIILGLLVLIGSFNYSCSFANADVKISPSLTPSQITRLYWESSFSGDEEVVEKLTTTIPDSFYGSCPAMENSNNKSNNITILTDAEIEETKSKTPAKTPFSVSGSDGKFARFYNPDAQNFSIYRVAKMIFMEKISYNDIIIENESIYEDQARIDIKYKFPKFKSDTGEVIFLTKTESGWRIFAVKNKEDLFLVGNKNYGKSKHLCNSENNQ